MERICEMRVSEGLPALAIQWGAIGEVGLFADMHANDKELSVGGTLPQSLISCFQELDGFLTQNEPIVCSMVVAEKKIKKTCKTKITILESVMDIMGTVKLLQ